ncbi:MAG: HlyD family efflux transporter periplasmic adaptor subunit [Clostridiaceae bacterium]|nr:HlyD family efflux transporter periplasmic adaptor subunit [Clostridiaceae bacterium]
MNQNRDHKRRRWPFVLLIVIVLLAIIAVPAGQFIQNRFAARLTLLDTAPVTREDLSATVYGSGVLESDQQSTLYAPANASAAEIDVTVGQRVSQGDRLAVLSSETLDATVTELEQTLDSLDQQIRQLPGTKGSSTITAPVSGRLKALYASADQPVQAVMDEHDALCVLSADGWLSLNLDDTVGDAAGEPGDPVTVTAETAGGKITADGLILQRQNGTITVVFDDKAMDAGIEASVDNQQGKRLGSAITTIHEPVYVTAKVGIIKTVRCQINDWINKGERLFTLSDATCSETLLNLLDQREKTVNDLQKAREQQKELVLTAPIDGVVIQLSLVEKGAVKEDQALCVLEGNAGFQMEVMVDELDISQVAVGQKATVSLAAYEYQTFTATVKQISAAGTTSGGVTSYPVLLSLDPADGLLSGMSGSADILVGEREMVLTVPLEALKVDGSRVYVTVVRTNTEQKQTTEDITVKVGLVSDLRAEIISGLTGDEQVQVVNTSDNTDSSRFGMGLR